jgi:uncharacterized RDD family membrane protein YckC
MYNPYAPPAAPIAVPVPVAGEPATRSRRLAGAIVDGLFDLAFQMAPAMVLRGIGLDVFPRAPVHGAFAKAMPSGVLMQLCFLLPAAVQWTLIARTGQSLGKKAVGTRIVTNDGRTAGFVHGVLYRAGPKYLLSLISTVLGAIHAPELHSAAVGGVIGALFLADWLFILRGDVRCIHDHIAGTHVVRAPRC